jgi:hypothetical protein
MELNMEKKEQGTRRDFLKGAALLGAGVLGASALAACSPNSSDSPSGGGGTSNSNVASGNNERVIGYCGPGDWLGEAPVIDESEITETIESDLVLLGSGHSGIGAVFSAVDEGLSVSVVEQQPWSAFVDLAGTGANPSGWYGEDIGHVNSQWLIGKGFGPFNTGEILTEFTKRAAGRVFPDIIKVFIENSGPMFDRYKEIYDSSDRSEDKDVYLTGIFNELVGDGSCQDGNYDMSNMFEYPLCNTQATYVENTYPTQGGGYKSWPCNAMFYGAQGNNIDFVHKYIVKYVQEHGATYYWEHTGIVLTTDESGTVTGLIAQDAEGKYKRFVGKKAVLLGAGDFIGNPDMCWALLNEGMEWAERGGVAKDAWVMEASRAGTGHKMACWVGGMIEPSPRGWMALGGGASGPWGVAPLLQLSENGERFFNEASVPIELPVQLRQPSQPHAWVSDINWKETVGNAPLDHGAPNFGFKDWMTTLEQEMDAIQPGPEGGLVSNCAVLVRGPLSDAMKGVVIKANTLDELAGYLGYEGEAKANFLASIERYNELCKGNGVAGIKDTDYGKDNQFMVPIENPPFIGGVAGGGPMAGAPHTSTPMMVTMSGLITDKYQNVLNKDWQPIQGLYACGNCLGGRYGLGYSTPFAGNSVGMAMTHGYTAAKVIAKL